ncbi:lichenan operon transcriptional antiterminator [Lentibacillus halodurans]|uniref:Lichenan operon transcriptional antiterminator n=1 Tax=Lentibacillus halodurans TaxID=237679 RepID=A0A1I0YHC2_9BACI|nr:BglG family transcription antiterminator [Lentibacillus halodurans]SFB12769.1 lichenan operon transcriptional antiterminator [Lentibacillus halodurans]
MNSRLHAIIKLLRNASGPVTSVQLSTEMQVSSKTIRNDIKELNDLLQNDDIQIESIRGKGYLLNMNKKTSFNQFFQENIRKETFQIPSEPGERVNYLMERILIQSDYLKMDDLADELYVSRSTLQSDLKMVREILKKYDLEINHKPNYGINVSGNETLIRFCISEYIFNQTSAAINADAHWLKIVSEKDLEVIQDNILTNLRKHQIFISDVSLQNLIKHLAIACKRIREENIVELGHDELDEMKHMKEFIVAEEMIHGIEKTLGIRFSENEVAYLSIHLKGAKLTNSIHERKAITAFVDDQARCVAKEMMHRIDAKYLLGLANDEELLKNLCLHLKPAINRYKHQMNIRNPMLEEIKVKYPLSFEAALVGASVLDEKLNITVDEDEIGYLAIHIELAQERLKNVASKVKRCMIVCASGLGSAQLLLYKLKKRFGEELEIIGTTEYYNLNQQSLKDLDFIVSTIPIQQDLEVPVIYVSTILGDRDVSQVERILTKEKSSLENYMIEKYTYLNQAFDTPESVICFLGESLIKDGKADNDYIDAVLERERYAPTSFGNLVAIPHPLEPKTDSTFWSIVTLKKPIEWGEKLVQLIFLLNVNKARKDDLKPMFDSLVKLIDNRFTVYQLLKCKTYEQFKNIIKNV